ncbi:uncharacterized protein LOC114799852 [Denticeps clupeoides]|uniref:uncharacterized protein LOC114799852 n=1 Tax=Denticeps clupeoides TaxID=299321 RepID=UPI0010A48E30|nr:uncharacterized protein LOC114799852 [Denticeps clupeoides]
MGSFTDNLGEPHCLWAMCQHPCCWEAVYRVAKGIQRPVLTPSPKEREPKQEGLPRLSVVNVSEWAECKRKAKRLERTEASVRRQSYQSQKKEEDDKAAQGPHLHPQLGSRHKSPDPNCTELRKVVKLNTALINPLVTCSSSFWGSNSAPLRMVGDPRKSPQKDSENRIKSSQMSVTELRLPSFNAMNPKIRKKSRRMMNRLQMQRLCSSTVSGNRASFVPWCYVQTLDTGLHRTDTKSQVHRMGKTAITADKDLVATEAGLAIEVGSPFLLRNKTASFHNCEEKRLKMISDAYLSVYKLDMTAKEGVDWSNLRAQPYLWKKCNPMSSIERLALRPLEGAVSSQLRQPVDCVDMCRVPNGLVCGERMSHHLHSPTVTQRRSLQNQQRKCSTSVYGSKRHNLPRHDMNDAQQKQLYNTRLCLQDEFHREPQRTPCYGKEDKAQVEVLQCCEALRLASSRPQTRPQSSALDCGEKESEPKHHPSTPPPSLISL